LLPFIALVVCILGYIQAGLISNTGVFLGALSLYYVAYLGVRQRVDLPNLAWGFVVFLFVCVCGVRLGLDAKVANVEFGAYPQTQLTLIDAPESKKRSLKVRAYLPKEKQRVIAYFPKGTALQYQDNCQVSGRLEQVDGRRNPGGFDYRRFLERQGVVGQFFVSDVQACESKPSWDLKRVALWVRARVHHVVRQELPKPYSELFLGLIFGQYGVELPEAFTTRFRVAGLTHLLVVSGSQISLISGVLLAALRVLRTSGTVTFGVMVLIHSIFYLITGGGASIFRAIVMFDIMLILSLMKRRPFSIHVGIVTMIVMMVINPSVIEDLGAQLSFLATFSLIAIAPLLRDRLPSTWPESIREMIGVSLAPFCLTTPLIWVSFHMLSPYSVIANCALMILVEWLVVLGFFTTLMGVLLPSLSFIYFNLCYAAMLIIDFVAVWVETLPFSQFFIPSPPIWVVVWMYMAFFYWCFSDQIKQNPYLQRLAPLFKYQVILGACLLCLMVWRFWPQPLQVWFLDVGQGDCILIRTPKRKHMLIDAGVKKRDFKTQGIRFDAGKRVVVPVLRHFGINHLDLVMISHMDMDHVGGMGAVLQHFSVGRILDNGNLPYDPLISSLLSSHQASRVTIQEGMTMTIEKDLDIQFLHPGADRYGLSENDQSLVMILRYKGHRFLFTGDLEARQERLLVERYGDGLDVDVLKVGHHGSSTSSTMPLLQAASPELAVIQVGRRNRYKHPNAQVLKRLKDFGLSIYRNDQQGAVLVESDGSRFTVTPTVH